MLHRGAGFLKFKARVMGLLSFAAASCAVYEPSLLEHDGGGSANHEHLSMSGAGNSAGGLDRDDGGSGSVTAVAGTAAGGSVAHPPGGSSGDEAGATQVPADGGDGGSVGIPQDPGGAGNSLGGGSLGGTGAAGGNAGTGGKPASTESRELAAGHPSTASTLQTTRGPEAANDGSQSTRWCASSTALPQWWKVDLGANFTIESVLVRWEFGNVNYTYSIDVSTNGTDFKSAATVDAAIGAPKTSQLPAGTKGRYVRVTTTKISPTNPSSIYEVTVKGY